MKKVFYLTLIVLFMLINIDVVKAATCSSEELARLKGLAANVSYNSEYIGNHDDVNDYQLYKVNFIGLGNELFVSDNYFTFYVNSDSEKIDVRSGVTKYEIYSKKCNALRLKTITIDLPKFNEYSTYGYCSEDGYKELYVCNPWYSGIITDDEFYDEISEYNAKLDEEDNSNVSNLKDIIIDNKYVIGLGTLFLSIALVIFIIVKSRKNRLD